MHQLVLASQSPRRLEILKNAGYFFSVIPTQISEIADENLTSQEQIRAIAQKKAYACIDLLNPLKNQDVIILAADTEVVLNKRLMGKPQSLHENKTYIRQLSGRKHEVITAVCLLKISPEKVILKSWLEHESTIVEFNDLTDTEIQDYVQTGDGLDKAGGYGVQSEAAKKLVKAVYGSWDNVMGLPMALVESGLRTL